MVKQNSKELLKSLPGIDRVLELLKEAPQVDDIPRSVQVAAARDVIEKLRRDVLDNEHTISEAMLSDASIMKRIKKKMTAVMRPNLQNVVNATGVVVHTNLGRSLLAEEALENLSVIGGQYSNLEFNLASGARGSRYSQVEGILCDIIGSEAAMVVNNNAGAVLLCLETIAQGKKVIVSRGELIEIGGSFRIPDIMAKSGARLVEVGTTNRTHLRDYENAIDDETGLLLKVHTSNYSVVGFTSSVSLKELVALGEKHQLPIMEDLGSGTFIDFSHYGIVREPTVQESVAAGADVVTFSGDKLLGGPQAGVIAGSKKLIDKIKQNPLTRALRIDKLTLAALETTLRLYRDERKAVQAIPTLRMLMLPDHEIEKKSEYLSASLNNLEATGLTVKIFEATSKAGGGAMPLLHLPSRCVGIRLEGMSANEIDRRLRENNPPVIGRIEDDFLMMDVRTIQESEIDVVADAVSKIAVRS
jgi:L-seryl-tRNA(Ser) seleniumtransferase